MATATKNRSANKQKVLTKRRTTPMIHFHKKREMASKLSKKAGLPGSFTKKK